MRLLVLANTAGVFSPIVDWMHKRGHDCRIVGRRMFDIFGHSKDTRSAVLVDSATDFYKEGMRQILDFRPDVIQISTHFKMLVAARLVAPRTPIVMTFHGSHIRGKSLPSEISLADMVTVTTPDLKRYGDWLDRVVPEWFSYCGGRVPDTAIGFYADFWLKDTRFMMYEWCRERNITLTLIDRSDNSFEPIPHRDMPALLSRFEYYLDFKGHGKEQFALSYTALEAMACGCKVIHDSDLDNIVPTRNTVIEEDYFNMYAALGRPSLWRAIRRLPRVILGLAKWIIRRKI